MSTATTSAVKEATNRRRRHIHRLKSYGQWDPYRDAEPVRAHLLAIMATGFSQANITAKTGVPEGTVRHILYGTHGSPPARKTATEHAEKLLAFWPSLDDYPPKAPLDSTGARRRLQALATLGWTILALAKHSNTPAHRLMYVMQHPTASAATIRVIRDLYNELWHRSPTADEVAPPLAQRRRTIAAQAGWNGPLAWDDEGIDDPKQRPRKGPKKSDKGVVDMAKVIRRLEGERLELNAMERTAGVEHGIRVRGLAYADVAELLGMELDTVKRTWERIKARARARSERWPDMPRWRDASLTAPIAQNMTVAV